MSDPIEVSVQEVQDLRARNDPFLLLDCREEFEHQTAAIDGAVLIPMGELSERINEIEPHRAQRIVVHCHHGGRSLRVAMALRQAGFDHAQSMAGGIDACSLEIDPTVPRY
ncbi:MAG: hypothetical protein KDJ29_21475 [Hyphomicrobiales bacterium]|nr:hypothetical protein [Hyphomicrobiales bacterium]